MTENKYHIHVGIFGCLGIQLTTEKQKARLGTLACLRVHAPGARLGSTPNSSSRKASLPSVSDYDTSANIPFSTLDIIIGGSTIGELSEETNIH